MPWIEKLLKISAALGGSLLFVLALGITCDVLVRWVTGRPFIGVFELAKIGLLAVTFLAIGLVQYEGRQLSVDILTSRLRGPAKRASRILDVILGLVFFGILLHLGIEAFSEAWAEGYYHQGLLAIPYTVHLGFLVVGCLLMCIALIGSVTAGSRNGE